MAPAREQVLSVPVVLTLTRVPLAAAFPFTIGTPFTAAILLAVAGLSDVLDGWYARRTGQATTAGAILDPVVDKLFVGTVVITLLLTGHLPVHAALLIGTRDILELPLAAWTVLRPGRLASRAAEAKPNALGKAVTVFQFLGVGAALVIEPLVGVLALLSAVAGVMAAASYWSRAIWPSD